MGRPTLLLHGPAAVDFFYDKRHVLRHSALLGRVLNTLFGRGAVHTLDGETHRVRKDLFTSQLTRPEGVEALGRLAREHWLRRIDGLPGRRAVLFDEMRRGACRSVLGMERDPLGSRGSRAPTG